MGVPALWEHIKTDETVLRVPFKQLVIDFKTDTGRSPRIAIDAFGWLFECGFYTEYNENSNSPSKSYRGGESLAIISLFKRLSALLALDVTFILVFDGPSKPEFKNRAKLKKAVGTDLEDVGSEHNTGVSLETCPFELDDTFFPDRLNLVKRFLKALNISWIDASGEGEAECARLQKLDLVDFIITNDSDAFIFGATKVLRNLSKFWEDLPASYAGNTKKKDHKETFITIFDISKLKNWNRDQIILFYALLGADYSQGVRGLGPKKSATLALLQEPNFSSEFTSIFKNPHLDIKERLQRYTSFQDRVFKHSQANSTALFGRNYFKSSAFDNFQGWPSEAALMHYFHPVVSSTVDMTSLTGDFVNISGNLTLVERNFRQLMELFSEYNLRSISNLRNWFHDTTHSAFVLKKLLKSKSEPLRTMKITDEWTSQCCQGAFHIKYLRVRYNSFLPGVEEPLLDDLENRNAVERLTTGGSRKSSPSKKQLERAAFKYMASIPKRLVPADHPLVLDYCSERAKTRDKRSPTKKRVGRKHSPQKNNLDDFLKAHTSPKKAEPKTEILETTSQRIELLPTKRQPFVGQDSELGESDDDWAANTSSLILVSEHECATTGAPTSPKRDLILTEHDYEINSEIEGPKESPLKKRHISTVAGKWTTKAPFLSQHIDLTIDSDG
ncbi:crossover junction endodeoxyribonuclease LALA0_S06e07778g [Lachancea lanzarotensis]|uniref:LALA0S06e07778g1_1 n=1 Tax=Lachancea lanzarotensis TaxID=1245769 RepID=A0A0C7N4S9_9SACH|nr:uncharacterized protein LALA0_S06e07778g [Lachancea lanzarotensis]CEP62957.1 LALA0S06e07778g1_1 [Lachancea lanzarotensis]